jgi:hypothetical protein
MEREEKLKREVEALKGIYRTKGIDLTDNEAEAIVHDLGNKPARAAIWCVVVIVALVIFLVLRFVL